MATQTQNYNLLKPSNEEFYDVSVANSNMELIDAALKKNEDTIGDANSQLDAIEKQTIKLGSEFPTTTYPNQLFYKFL